MIDMKLDWTNEKQLSSYVSVSKVNMENHTVTCEKEVWNYQAFRKNGNRICQIKIEDLRGIPKLYSINYDAPPT